MQFKTMKKLNLFQVKSFFRLWLKVSWDLSQINSTAVMFTRIFFYLIYLFIYALGVKPRKNKISHKRLDGHTVITLPEIY